MKFNVNQQDFQQALNYCQGVIEKRSTLPILSNILLDAQNSQLTITATDLDLIFIHKINNVEVLEEGKTTTVSSTIYDRNKKIYAKVMVDGSIKHKQNEGSIHKVAAQILGSESCNGWTYWHYQSGNSLKPIDELRQRLRPGN